MAQKAPHPYDPVFQALAKARTKKDKVMALNILYAEARDVGREEATRQNQPRATSSAVNYRIDATPIVIAIERAVQANTQAVTTLREVAELLVLGRS